MFSLRNCTCRETNNPVDLPTPCQESVPFVGLTAECTTCTGVFFPHLFCDIVTGVILESCRQR